MYHPAACAASVCACTRNANAGTSLVAVSRLWPSVRRGQLSRVSRAPIGAEARARDDARARATLGRLEVIRGCDTADACAANILSRSVECASECWVPSARHVVVRCVVSKIKAFLST